MSMQFVLALNDAKADLATVGGKGASLARLMNAGLPVPDGFHVTTTAYNLFVEENQLQTLIDDALAGVHLEEPATMEKAAKQIRAAFEQARMPPEIASAIVGAYGDLPGREPAVAVRSSATAEDLPEASFAGQQESYLNVSRAENVLEAVKKCWSSLWTARAIGYRARQGISSEGVALAAVVQILVPAEVAGILFTVNPVAGDRDQAQISASWGLGDAVVGGRVTPDDFAVDKRSGRVVKRTVADKEVMTVRVNGATEDRSVPTGLRQVPVLQDDDLSRLTRLGVQIEELFGMPVDIEWALADGDFSVVQARPITALPELVVPPPNEWQLPEPKGRYMRASIIDMMPDPLSPLFATLGVTAYNAGLIQMMADFTGAKRLTFPENLVVTIQDYAYMQVNFTFREWWMMLSKLGPRIPKLIRNGPDHFREVALPAYLEKVRSLEAKSAAEMPVDEIWRDVHELMMAAVYHLSVLQVDTLGAAAGSEGLFTAVYGRFFRQNGDPPAAAFLMGYDTTPIRSEKSLYDLAQWALTQAALSDYLLEADTAVVTKGLSSPEPPSRVAPDVWQEFRNRVIDHQQAFGHILYDLDLAKPIPAEDAAPLLETMKMYLRGQGANPHERQEKLARERELATEQLLARARGLRGWAVRKALGWATSMGQVREDSIASIGLAYPRLRQLLKELGRRLVLAGAIAQAEDVFWLEESEIAERLDALEKEVGLASMQAEIELRKKSRQAAQKFMPPTQLPHSKTYMGIPIEVFVPGEGGQEGDRLKGVAASTGKVTGLACVLHGPEDFDQMRPGGILVAKLTTPAWTPLFAMAGAVVTDIGGPLSHGSIVAREYGIPAVLGTVAATRVIETGQTITVDGDAGTVILATAES